MDSPTPSRFLNKSSLIWAALLNLPFLLCHPAGSWVQDSLGRSLLVNLVLFFAPGVPLVGAWKKARWNLLCGMGVILASLAVFLGILGFFVLTGGTITPSKAWNATWVLTNIAFLGCLLRDTPRTWKPPAQRSFWTAGVSTFFLSYALFWFGATKVVPAQQDHDMEVQGTGYSLLMRLEPLLLTDRDTYYYFAHPPLLHFYVAGFFLYYDKVEHLQKYDELSLRALAAQQREAFEPPEKILVKQGKRVRWHEVTGVAGAKYVVSPPLPNGHDKVKVSEAEVNLSKHHYHSKPFKLLTRAPTLFFAALTAALLAVWASRLSGKEWVGALAGLAYASSPEVFVRSSYGGYFGISNFSVLLVLWTTAHWMRHRARATSLACFLAGGIAALANHKLVPLPASLFFFEGLRAAVGPHRLRFVRNAFLHPGIWGFVAGTAAFWVYGASIDFAAFWKDHIEMHVMDRVTHHNPLGYGGYPSVPALWMELAAHTGWVLLPLSVGTLCLGILREFKSARGLRILGHWSVWMALIGTIFSVIDWKMTKHLMPLMIPLFLIPVVWSERSRSRLALVSCVFAGLLLWHGWMVMRFAKDFSVMKATPLW